MTRRGYLPSPRTVDRVFECIQQYGPVCTAEIARHTGLSIETAIGAARVLFLHRRSIHIAGWNERGASLYAVGNLPNVPRPAPKRQSRQDRPHLPCQPLPPIAWLIEQPLPTLSKHT